MMVALKTLALLALLQVARAQSPQLVGNTCASLPPNNQQACCEAKGLQNDFTDPSCAYIFGTPPPAESPSPAPASPTPSPSPKSSPSPSASPATTPSPAPPTSPAMGPVPLPGSSCGSVNPTDINGCCLTKMSTDTHLNDAACAAILCGQLSANSVDVTECCRLKAVANMADATCAAAPAPSPAPASPVPASPVPASPATPAAPIAGATCATVTPCSQLDCCITKDEQNIADAYCEQLMAPGALCTTTGPAAAECCAAKADANTFDPSCCFVDLSPGMAPAPAPMMGNAPTTAPMAAPAPSMAPVTGTTTVASTSGALGTGAQGTVLALLALLATLLLA